MGRLRSTAFLMMMGGALSGAASRGLWLPAASSEFSGIAGVGATAYDGGVVSCLKFYFFSLLPYRPENGRDFGADLIYLIDHHKHPAAGSIGK
jgi:hypothetical protein